MRYDYRERLHDDPPGALLPPRLAHNRKKVLEYLAVNSAPDISAALGLTAIANEYERIGDYCKDLAELRTSYGVECDPNCDMCKSADNFHKLLTEQFDAVHGAVKNEDEALAAKSDRLNEKVKALRSVPPLPPGSQQVTGRFVLMRSRLDPAGAVYEEVASWPLGPAHGGETG